MTGFGKISLLPRFSKILKTVGNFRRVYFVIVKMFNLLWRIVNAIGHIFIAANGQILESFFTHLVTLDVQESVL